jgi:hypothetical protein
MSLSLLVNALDWPLDNWQAGARTRGFGGYSHPFSSPRSKEVPLVERNPSIEGGFSYCGRPAPAAWRCWRRSERAANHSP